MSSVNKVILVGHLGSDPESKTVGSTQVTTFRLATSESFTGRDGNKQERTEWHTIVCWAKLAELAQRYLAKGRQVFVEGSIRSRTWDKPDGTKGYATEINARELTFLGGGKGDGHRDDSGQPAVKATTQGGSADFSEDVPF